ncbi:tRNA pseudouridine(55) synthase TruB [Aquirufa ecclesiirivi]|uniref:tRNA pseudouridine synthase B n=1 Tax=Aquirufa ecclesiirivi TaxID=2715124 RepID=A0ABT4JD37_9BACT|nr:tRNA pseudouridine(55) synthase TruB [Aquirufa ecclesiirivi]MCZ2472117.1 tRNA pseudouridine(55) synthase TruB [Aquirufa ecclesiirivi]MCZ2474205.1 tRNA pseudouridine(55) synthase TruB [Aquirufa ecclesiirivi]MDF0693825.1 tRNA pseudouridine(55) synthase TruB [Aquirufa ecclesiirivi]NHC48503.1 tRNA pseudouridine(55) synthase TruB [Aquirufa ecclesiirivi]
MVELTPIEDKFYLIDKPKTWTSFDAVRKIRNMGRFKKIGHAGTLDPLATGLLIICVGKYTKKIEYFQSLPKTYTGSFVLGKTTPSIDLETDFDHEFPIDHITPSLLEDARLSLVGEIEQVPPIYSAIKQNGQRLYVQARKGLTEKDVEIKIRQATVHVFDMDISSFPEIKFKISCSKGTYIRSMVRDFGFFLNSGAYLKDLVRSQIGDYTLEKAQSIEKFSAEQYEILL